jgi:hypothetical protein
VRPSPHFPNLQSRCPMANQPAPFPPFTTVGTRLQFGPAPRSRHWGRPPRHEVGCASDCLRFPSARRSRARHRPLCQGTSPSSPALSAPGAVVRHEGSSCADRSALPWSFASSASHSRHGPVPVRRPSAQGSGRVLTGSYPRLQGVPSGLRDLELHRALRLRRIHRGCLQSTGGIAQTCSAKGSYLARAVTYGFGHKPSLPARSKVLPQRGYERQLYGGEFGPRFGPTRPQAVLPDALESLAAARLRKAASRRRVRAALCPDPTSSRRSRRARKCRVREPANREWLSEPVAARPGHRQTPPHFYSEHAFAGQRVRRDHTDGCLIDHPIASPLRKTK